MISNASCFVNEELNRNNSINNIYNNSTTNCFNKYNSPNLNEINDGDIVEWYFRKNIFEIKDELNNISTNLSLFLNEDNFLYNFKN